tara:strand:- start:32 stop:2461 length:2430 start_codon:yes stop_codon:yes gene_type:complete
MALFAKNLAPSSTDRALGAADIQRSLRFNHDDSPYLSFTPSTTGNQKIWTFSAWIKRTEVTDDRHYIYSANDGNSGYFALYFDNDNIKTYFDPGNNYGTVNDREYRDVTAWMHIVHQVDATNTVQRIWINGVEETLSSSRNPGNNNYPMNESGKSIVIGRHSWGTSYYSNWYLAEVNHVDGQLISPTDFGFTDPVTNIWMPKRYEGTYGTNGFYLDFSDNSSTAALGIDKSPNGNDFTVNNFSVGAWPDNDSVIDTPTNNFNTFNENDKNSNVPLANGALETAATATGGHYPAFTTMPVKSGKWYLEWKFLTNDSGLPSIMEAGHDEDSYNTDSTVGNNTSTVNKRGYGFLPGNGNTSSESGYASYGSALTSSDIGQCAFDADTGKIYWGKNNTWFNSGNPETGANPAFSGIDMSKEYLFTWHVYGNNNNVSVNFGSQGFTYTPPAGFKALCQRNLPLNQAPSVISRPQRHFEAITYDGNGSARSITGLEFKPDFVWIKERTASTQSGNRLFDSIRGAGNVLLSDGTQAELDRPTELTSFDNNGFSLGDATTVNENGSTVVAWCWKAGGTAVTNNDGSLASSVSVNREAGFSIVVYTGNGTAGGGGTIGHGLGKAPEIMIVKNRADASNWSVNGSIGGLIYGTNKLQLHSSAAIVSDTNEVTVANATTFTVTTSGATNGQNDSHVAYCWVSVPGFSKMSSYTGNGAANGQRIHLGFRPACIIIKNASTSTSWVIYDNKRSPSNEIDEVLYPSSTGARVTGDNELDFLADGFKLRTGSANKINSGGKTYIYMAWAEQPGITAFDTFPNAR